MSLQDVLNKQVFLIMDPISPNDVLKPTSFIPAIWEKIQAANNISDLITIYTDDKYKVKAILFLKELSDLLSRITKLLKEGKSVEKFEISKLDLERYYPIKIGENALYKNAKIKDALEALKGTDTLVIIDEQGIYQGKVYRSELDKRIKLLL